eukprot:gene11451-biopygen9034
MLSSAGKAFHTVYDYREDILELVGVMLTPPAGGAGGEGGLIGVGGVMEVVGLICEYVLLRSVLYTAQRGARVHHDSTPSAVNDMKPELIADPEYQRQCTVNQVEVAGVVDPYEKSWRPDSYEIESPTSPYKAKFENAAESQYP